MDKTYDIGIYHVTTLSYTNVKLINRETKKNPLFLGPMYIHKKSKNENFEFFLQQLKCKFNELSVKLNCNNNYEYKLIFCSDQEPAIINAIQKVFPYSTLIFCYTHIIKSIGRSVDSTNLSNKISNLVFCNSIDNFNSKVTEIVHNMLQI